MAWAPVESAGTMALRADPGGPGGRIGALREPGAHPSGFSKLLTGAAKQAHARVGAQVLIVKYYSSLLYVFELPTCRRTSSTLIIS